MDVDLPTSSHGLFLGARCPRKSWHLVLFVLHQPGLGSQCWV